MKQAAIILILFSCLNIFSDAQDFRAGPLGGFSFSQVDGDKYSGFNKIGLNVGAFVTRHINDKWDLQLDIAYTQKGSRQAPDIKKGIEDDFMIYLAYIQFPIVGRFRYKQVSFEIGGSIGTLINSKEEWDGQNIEDVPGAEPVSFKNMEYASIIGFNYHFNDQLWINGRLTYSYNRIRIPYDGEFDIYSPKPHWLSRKPGEYNNCFIVSVYYSINKLLQ